MSFNTLNNMLNEDINNASIAEWNKKQCQHYDGVWINCAPPGDMHRWYNMYCVEDPEYGETECYGWGSAVGKTGGVIQHTLVLHMPPPEDTEEMKNFIKEIELYAIIGMLIISGIAIVVLIL